MHVRDCVQRYVQVGEKLRGPLGVRLSGTQHADHGVAPDVRIERPANHVRICTIPRRPGAVAEDSRWRRFWTKIGSNEGAPELRAGPQNRGKVFGDHRGHQLERPVMLANCDRRAGLVRHASECAALLAIVDEVRIRWWDLVELGRSGPHVHELRRLGIRQGLEQHVPDDAVCRRRRPDAKRQRQDGRHRIDRCARQRARSVSKVCADAVAEATLRDHRAPTDIRPSTRRVAGRCAYPPPRFLRSESPG